MRSSVNLCLFNNARAHVELTNKKLLCVYSYIYIL